MDISESNDAVSAEIRVMWAYAGGGTDGPGGAVAKGWYPKWSLGELAGDLHFDGAETWTAAADIETDAHGIEAVALHEIGHCLGLGHCSDPDSVMHFEYKRGAHVLTSVDLTAIGAKYADVLLA